MADTTPAPWLLARAHQIITLRRRHNTSGQLGEDIANIVAALAVQHPEIGKQLDFFALE